MAVSFWRTALVLALLSAVGPFAIDLYLPAMPAIGADLGAPVAAVQNTLTLYFVAFGVAQLVWGPLADRFGRKPPVMLGLAVFLAGSVMAALAADVQALVWGRVVQGLGAAAVMVVPRAIIRDQMTGPEATRLMAAIMMVTSVSPMLAPLVGAGILAVADWRVLFWVLAGAAVMSLTVTALFQPETLAREARVPISPGQMARGARVLLTDPVYMGLTLVGALGFSTFFIFISSASFVYAGQFGLSPVQFGLAFAVNAMAFFAASQFAGPLGARHGMARVMRLAAIGFALATGIVALAALAGFGTLAVIITGLALGNACLGLIIPTTMVMALDDHGAIAGLASSLGGTLQMLIGGAITFAAGPFFDGTATPMLVAIMICAVAALGVALWVLPQLRGQGAPAG
jgi:DHA1 family bicyclomycin/chloramphenicol resistance-like MFS transporter